MIEIIGILLAGLGITYTISKVAEHRGVYIVDRGSLEQWLKKVYHTRLRDLPSCASCGNKVSIKKIGRIFNHKNKIFVICDNRACKMKSNFEIIKSSPCYP